MKTYFVVAAAVGLMASASSTQAAQSNSHKLPVAPVVDVCAGAKGLMFGAYFEFLKQHPQCAKPIVNQSSLSSAGGGKSEVIQYVSDRALKHCVELVDVLTNGLRLYSYRYLGDERAFVGVMAQDLADDERFAHAVHLGADRFMRVDYAALGLEVVGMEAMREAGAEAVRLAMAA